MFWICNAILPTSSTRTCNFRRLTFGKRCDATITKVPVPHSRISNRAISKLDGQRCLTHHWICIKFCFNYTPFRNGDVSILLTGICSAIFTRCRQFNGICSRLFIDMNRICDTILFSRYFATFITMTFGINLC